MARNVFSPTGADVCNLVICFDGTWNTENPDSHENEDFTNVFLMQEMILQDKIYEHAGEKHISHVTYVEGPGTKEGHKLLGGLFASDLDEAVKEGYKDLFKNYRKCQDAGVDVRIFLFGFSRGAYICHIFSWLMQVVGIPDITLSNCDEVVDSFMKKDANEINQIINGAKVLRPRIVMMGLWDVVSSLKDKFRGYFNGLKSPLVGCVWHAMAADERRPHFPVMHYLPGDSIVQMWFPGVHSEVGGGYADDEVLHTISLRWMQNAAKRLGLAFARANFQCNSTDFCVSA